MLTRILHNSPALCIFIEQLDLSLSQPQLRHVCNLADALLVCDSDKTLAALQRQFVECVNASNMADTLRIAPWTAQDVRQPVGAFLVQDTLAQARQAGPLDYICVSLLVPNPPDGCARSRAASPGQSAPWSGAWRRWRGRRGPDAPPAPPRAASAR